MKIIDYIDAYIPAYALTYFVNGDSSGMSDEEAKHAEGWIESAEARLRGLHPDCRTDITYSDSDDTEFVHHPAWGLASHCVRVAVIALVPNDHPAESITLPDSY